MAKYIDSSIGVSISDLMNENGFTFDVEEQDFDDEEFAYSSNVHFSNEEILTVLNMNNVDNKEDEENGREALNGLNFENLRKKMTPITSDQKVMKYVQQKGVGECVPFDAQVTFHYIAYYEEGDTPFDSSYDSGKPRTARVEELLPGLGIGLVSMQKDEIAAFLIHPDLAYLAVGCLPLVPPNSVVLFVVHLLNFLDYGSADTLENLTIEEKQSFEYVKKTVAQKLATAKHHVNKHNIKQAIREYKTITDILEKAKLKDDSEEQEMFKLLIRTCTNLAICYNKEDMPRNACIACLRIPEKKRTAKIYYNFGKALLALGEYKSAMTELQRALKMEPKDELIKKAINRTSTEQTKYLEIEKQLWKNSFRSKIDETEKVSKFQKAARELCESIISKNVLRQPLPTEGFTEEEYQILRDEAAKQGLNILHTTRYGQEAVYIQKGKA